MQRSELAHVLRASERIDLLDAAKHDLTYISRWTQRRAQEALP